MDVPLFPAPPTLGGAPTPRSDVADFAKFTCAPLSAVGRKRHVAPKARRISGLRRIQRFARKNLVYPKSRNPIRHRVTEFRIRMTERQRNDDKDDEDVVCAIGTAITPLFIALC